MLRSRRPWRGKFRAVALPSAEAHRRGGARGDVFLFAVFADGGVQRAAGAVAICRVLPGSGRPGLHRSLRHLSPAVCDEHAALVVAGAAVPHRGAQRGNQYHCLQPAVDAGARDGIAGRIRGRRMVPCTGRGRERFGQPGQRARNRAAAGLQPAGRTAASGAACLGAAMRERIRGCAAGWNPPRRSRSPGTGPRRWRRPTGAALP